MDLMERLSALADRVGVVRGNLHTEEATKNALVMPFIQALGYDVFNPLEVVPEFTADVGIKKGEKVDYAIVRDGKPLVLIECKCCGARLDGHGSQLFRYFGTTSAKLSILTDGVHYRFFTDLEQPNRMDEKPFITLDLTKLDEFVVQQLAKITKAGWDLDGMVAAAEMLRDKTRSKAEIAQELAAPSDDFLAMVVRRIYSGRLTQGVLDKYRPIVQRAISDHIAELVDQRLKKALATNRIADETAVVARDSEPVAANGSPIESAELPQAESGDDDGDERPRIETTMEELEGYFIVKAILQGEVDLRRVTHRDGQTYFSILLDDNNRKPIARLWFNRSKKYLGVFDAEKNETRIPVERPEDIFEHGEAIRMSLGHVHKPGLLVREGQ